MAASIAMAGRAATPRRGIAGTVTPGITTDSGVMIVALPDAVRWTAAGAQEQLIEVAGMRHGRLNVLPWSARQREP